MEFNSLPQILDCFKDEKSALKYYENLRWQGKPYCPHCGSQNPYKTKRGYKCSDVTCKKKFNVKTGTIFQGTKLNMRLWFAAIFLFTTSKKGISSIQLSKQLGITQKTAWFMLHRIREMLRDKNPKMLNGDKTVEVDEAYVGGRESNKHYSKKRSKDNPDLTIEGKPYVPKKVVIGMVERGGKIILSHIPKARRRHMTSFIRNHLPKGSVIYSDEHTGYETLAKTYTHSSVKHFMGKYVEGNVYTNTIESFWSILKRGIYGIYHHVSQMHFHRYLDEFAYRYNYRSIDKGFRVQHCLKQAVTRLSYKKLILRT